MISPGDGAGRELAPFQAIIERGLQEPARIAELDLAGKLLPRERKDRAAGQRSSHARGGRHQALFGSELIVRSRVDRPARFGVRLQIEPVPDLLQQPPFEQPQRALDVGALDVRARDVPAQGVRAWDVHALASGHA